MADPIVIYTEIDSYGNPTGKTVAVETPEESPAWDAGGTFVIEEKDDEK